MVGFYKTDEVNGFKETGRKHDLPQVERGVKKGWENAETDKKREVENDSTEEHPEEETHWLVALLGEEIPG